MHATLATQEAPCGRMMGMKTDIDHSCHNSSSSRSQELVVDGQCCSARSPLRYREVMLTSLNHQEKSEAGNCNMPSSCCGCGGCSGCTGCGCGCGCNAGCCGCGGLGGSAKCAVLPFASICHSQTSPGCVPNFNACGCSGGGTGGLGACAALAPSNFEDGVGVKAVAFGLFRLRPTLQLCSQEDFDASSAWAAMYSETIWGIPKS